MYVAILYYVCVCIDMLIIYTIPRALFQLVKSGVSGPRGPPGVCSCNLTTLFAPGNIPELLPGPPGNPGTNGQMGLTGLPVSIYDNNNNMRAPG